MYNLHNITDAYKFQERLANTRKNKGFTQAALGDKIGVDRQSIANWENGTMPPLPRLIDLCDVLETDPNYLLGVTDFPSQKLENISKEINLSYESTCKLHTGNFTNVFIEYLLSCSNFDNLIFNIKQLCYSSRDDINLTNRLTDSAIKKLKKVYKSFNDDLFLDMSLYNFTKHVSKVFDYKDTQEFESFINETLTEKEYKLFKLENNNIDKKSDDDKYNALIEHIAQIGFECEFERKSIEISTDKIRRHMAEIVEGFIRNEIKKQKDEIYIFYPN